MYGEIVVDLAGKAKSWTPRRRAGASAR